MPPIRLLFCSLALLSSLPAQAELQVDWPDGWQVREMPAPQSPFEPGVSGERVRGMQLRADGEQLVVAELTRLPLANRDGVEVDQVLAQMRQGVQLGFARSGLMTRCAAPADSRMGPLAAREVACTISQGETPALRQHLLLALGEQAVYSLSYAVRADSAASLDETLRQLREGLRLN